MNGLHTAILGHDVHGMVMSWTAGAEHIFGYTQADILGTSILRLLPPAWHAEVEALWRRLAQGERLAPLTTVRLRRDGQSIPVEITMSAVHDHLGQMVAVTEVVRQVGEVEQRTAQHLDSPTEALSVPLSDGRALPESQGAPAATTSASEHQTMEMALRQSEARFRALVDASAQIVWTADAHGVITEDSPSWRAFTGKTHQAGCGNGWLEVLHPDDRERIAALWQQIVKTQPAVVTTEYRLRHASGEWRWMAVRAVRLLDAAGKVQSWVGMNTDITEQKRAEALSHGQKQILEMIASGAPLYPTLDALLRVLEASAEEMLCSILLRAADGIHLQHGAAPRLPRAYIQAIDGVPIGPYMGSCGTAAFRREPVFVEDIATDPLWVDYRDTALQHGLRACWSSPIFDEQQRVLGTFAIYYRQPALPDDNHLQLIDIATSTVAICLSRHRAEEALRDSEHHFRQIAESLPQLVWTCEPDGPCDFLSRQWVEYTGIPATAQMGFGWLEQVHPDDREPVMAAWSHAVATGSNFHVEFRLRRHDGMYRWFDTRAGRLRDAEGRTVKWFGSNTDMHDAYGLREALREEKERFTKIAATAPGVIYAYRLRPDGSTCLPYASPGIAEICGLQPAAVADSDAALIPLIHPADLPSLRTSVLQSARTLYPWRQEFRVRHPSKGELWVEGYATPAREPDGSVLWYGFLTDITERKHAEETLHTSQTRLRTALDASGMGTWIWDMQQRILWWDDASIRIWGRTREEMADGRVATMMPFIHPEDRAQVQAASEALLQGRSDELMVEFRTLRPDGALQWLASRGRLERDATGRPWRMTGTCVDITGRKRAEAIQLRSQKLEALGTLAGGIAHDFNNILLAITGNTQLAMTDLPANHPVQENLAEIIRAGSRATELVRQILTFSRPHEQRRTAIALQPIVEEALRLMRATLPAMIEMQTHCAPDVPMIEADATQLHQIVVNLGTNAAHAIGLRSGLIVFQVDTVEMTPELSVSAPDVQPGRYVRLSVRDNGCGMERATIERIFDPFFTTKQAGQGTGLGLSVVHGILQSYGGTVTVASQPGQGSTFQLYFPAAESAMASVSAEPPESVSNQSGHILYVDDDLALVRLGTHTLERLGYQVTGHTDPTHALQEFLARPQKFDAVITDFSMPGMSGFELARSLLAARPAIPILLTSGYLSPADQDTALQLGIREWLAKPSTLRELRQALARLFHASPPP